MKRTPLAAFAAIAIAAGIWAYQSDTRPLGAVHAQNTTVAAATAPPGKQIPESSAVDQDAPYHEACAREGLNESECVGRLIWFKATGGNERFHTYTFQQRIGVLVDWYRVLRADQRGDLRFRLVPGRRCAAQVRRQDGLCRPGLRPQGCRP